jgi:hypothetical protein
MVACMELAIVTSWQTRYRPLHGSAKAYFCPLKSETRYNRIYVCFFGSQVNVCLLPVNAVREEATLPRYVIQAQCIRSFRSVRAK